jgi:hypothetical protein
MKTNYYIVIENKETKYLKTTVSDTVINLMLIEYKKFHESLKRKDEYSFQKFLEMHGIPCVYDGTFGWTDVDKALANEC